MKKLILIFTLLISANTLSAQSDSSPVIIGVFSDSVTGSDFFKEWLIIHGEPSPNAETVSKLKAIPTSNFSFRIYMGTWCEDSQIHVPRFIKIADKLGWKYSLIGVNREKECPFEKKECKTWDIQFVPTMVVYRDEIEVGRIIENPKTSIEDDLLDIITKGLN
jgi:hypothetical protein